MVRYVLHRQGAKTPREKNMPLRVLPLITNVTLAKLIVFLASWRLGGSQGFLGDLGVLAVQIQVFQTNTVSTPV
jgi:hypothetical protein